MFAVIAKFISLSVMKRFVQRPQLKLFGLVGDHGTSNNGLQFLNPILISFTM